MLAKVRGCLTYGNVMATIAVFIALGGGAYAATQINGADLQNRSVAGKKLMLHAVGRPELNLPTLGLQSSVKWALVGPNGGIIAQSGGISMSQHEGGNYYLNFGSNIKRRPIVVTPAEKFTSVGRVGVEGASCGGGAVGANCPAPVNDGRHVYVLTTDETQASGDQPEGFYVVVFP